MASFTTHLYGGALVSSAVALGAYSAGLAGPGETQTWFFLGVAGSLLPDIDSDSSAPVRGFFTLLGIVLAFLVSFALVGRFPVLELALIWGTIFLLVRYGVFEVFARCTVHRGVWHSWLAAVFAGLATANAAHHLLGLSAWESWVGGIFVTLGYLTHLCLDELASVELLGNRVKRSFGTALKPFSMAAPWASALMLAAVIALVYAAPTFEPVMRAWRGQGLPVAALEKRLFGSSNWLVALRSALN
ncbi:MAG: metal-dependent hydrolase [Chromatiaceae bacterium]